MNIFLEIKDIDFFDISYKIQYIDNISKTI